MRPPLQRGAAINAQRFGRWLADFSAYRNQVTQHLIELWFDQFADDDRDLAARILDAVHFIGPPHMHGCFRSMLDSLEHSGWNRAVEKRKGRWVFVPFSGSAGESADTMVHAFRMANNMANRHFNEFFIHRSELVGAKLGSEDTVVLIDDFSGSGEQACTSWKELFAELLAGGPRVVLMLVAATSTALKRIASETEMEPLCATSLPPGDNVFAKECKHFTDADKKALFKYCKWADKKSPLGFGDCGLVVVLSHRCPNNSIPILHCVNKHWQGLFPRHG